MIPPALARLQGRDPPVRSPGGLTAPPASAFHHRVGAPEARLVPITVQAYAGYKADETPRAFDLAGRRVTVLEIVDRWYQAGRDPALPSASYFKIRSEDGGVFILKRDNESLRWYVTG